MKFTSSMKYETQDVVIEIIMTAVAKRANAKGLPLTQAVPLKLVDLVMKNHKDVDGKVKALKELAKLFKKPPAAGEFFVKLLKLAWPWHGEIPSEEEILLLANELLKQLGIGGNERNNGFGRLLG